MTETNEVTFESLIGEHVLDGVDTFVERVKSYGDQFEDANAIAFRLDGLVYVGIENPDDGYRSSMEKFYVSTNAEIKNAFPAIRVLARKKANSDYCVNDTMELVDLKTGKVILEVGTDNTDDYYPSFVSAFWPEHMATNTPG